MLYFLIIFIPAFIWLLYETKWLTVRLPFGKNPLRVHIEGLISMAIGLTLMPIIEGIVEEIIEEDEPH